MTCDTKSVAVAADLFPTPPRHNNFDFFVYAWRLMYIRFELYIVCMVEVVVIVVAQWWWRW